MGCSTLIRPFASSSKNSERNKRAGDERSRQKERDRSRAPGRLKSRARLTRGFSHDVKNPLGAADGFLSLLMEGIPSELSEDQKRYVARARSAIDTSLRLIDDILSLSRAEAGHLDIEWEPVDVRAAAREIGEQYRVQAEAKGLDMVIDLPDQLPLIESDATRVRQIFGNLFTNAVKYTDRGSVRVTVRVHPGPGAPGLDSDVGGAGAWMAWALLAWRPMRERLLRPGSGWRFWAVR